MRGRMTLFADASWCPKTKAAGWGSWAIRDDWDRGRFNGGPINLKAAPVNSSSIAELAAIATALWSHDGQGDLDGLTEILIQSDSVAALGMVKWWVPNTRTDPKSKVPIFAAKPKKPHPSMKPMLEAIEGILARRQLVVKHVKGHSGVQDGRSWVNEQCDREAKRHMQEQRRLVYGDRV